MAFKLSGFLLWQKRLAVFLNIMNVIKGKVCVLVVLTELYLFMPLSEFVFKSLFILIFVYYVTLLVICFIASLCVFD